MQKWWVGCSGFHYKEWKETFYPKGLAQSKWFDYYATHFNTLELNVTFYRFPQLSFLEKWHSKSPENFKFSVKAPQAITHYKQFVDVQQLTDDFYSVVKDGLKEKTGCILFQMPPRMLYSQEKLAQIISSLNPSFNNVVEFRNASWWNDEVYEKLSQHNITFCSISHPTLPDSVVKLNKTIYLRFHGSPQLFKSTYDDETLQKVADEITDNMHTTDVYAYFNNTMTAGSIANAKVLEEYVKLTNS